MESKHLTSMNPTNLRLAACGILALAGTCLATPENRNTDWFQEARYGIFMHFLPADSAGLARVKDFDVEALAGQLEAVGARYFVLTLGQNSGYFNSPNAAYDRITGYAPGERCSARDLPLDLHRALQPRGIRLMLYLPCQVPNQDARAQKAFRLPQGKQDQPIDLEFAHRWAEVIREWSDRYGEKVAGWWFDGGYDPIHFNEVIAVVYAAAAKHGNPKAIVTFNPGVKVIHHTGAEDYTAGELNEPFQSVPASRWLGGSQWHALTYLGSNWGQRDTRYPQERWADWVRAVVTKGGVVTLDLGPNWDPQKGPIGSLAEGQVNQVRAIRAAVRPDPAAAGPKRLRRADSFLGVHFDFHAGPDCTEIGKNTTREMIENVIDQVHPNYLETGFKQELVTYVQGGGNLLLVGPRTASIFAPELGVTLDGTPRSGTRYLAHGGALTPTRDLTQSVTLGNAQPFDRLHESNNATSAAQPAASIATEKPDSSCPGSTSIGLSGSIERPFFS